LNGARQAQRAFGIAIALQHLALVAALRGEVRSASLIAGYVNAKYKELGSEREYTEQWGYEKLMVALRESLSDSEIAKLVGEGEKWTEDQALEVALNLT
jgi:hypothetical protein